MAKPVPAEGPWRSFSVSLRQADLERLDAVLGGKNRSEWTREVILADLNAREPFEPQWSAPPALPPPVVATTFGGGGSADLSRLSVEAHVAQVAAEAEQVRQACRHPGVARKARCPKCRRYNT
jgi:hypothetical protein